MHRKPVDVVSGLAIYLLAAALIGISIALRIPPGAQFAIWLSTSYDPQKALIFFSFFTSGVFLVLARGGIELAFFKLASFEDVKRYIAGLPLWVLFFCIAISALGFWFYSPRCKPPEAVYFEIVGTQARYEPMSVMEVSPNQSLSIVAKPSDANALLSCISWEYVGPSFQTPGEKFGCQINLKFSDRPGSSFLTLAGTQNFCSQTSIFSLEIKMKNP